jgi:hypothetical protein
MSTLLYTEQECLTCGGTGYGEGDEGRSYHVHVYLNGKRTINVTVKARNGGEALVKAAEHVEDAVAGGLKPGDALGIEVKEE